LETNVVELFCCISAFNFGVEDKSGGTIQLNKSLQLWSWGQKSGKLFCCIRAFNFGVEDKCGGTILLNKSLQLWSWGQKSGKVYASTSIDNLRPQPAFGRLRITPKPGMFGKI